MKKLLLLLSVLSGLLLGLTSCVTETNPAINEPQVVEDNYYVINYYDEGMLYFTQSVLEGTVTSIPGSIGKEGYVFEYWTLESIEFSFDSIINGDIDLFASWNQINTEEPLGEDAIDEDGLYTSRDEVALYIATFHKLPNNYMTKSEASGGIRSHWTSENKASIGGDVFGNREGLLPSEPGRTFTELDINYNGGSRGAERIVYSSDFRIFYTDDHYDSFVEYDKETGQWISY